MSTGIHRPIRALAALLVTATAATGAFAAGVAGAGQAPDMGLRFESALERYERGHYDAAFEALAALADDGHCEAARIAHQMARLGRTLYPTTFGVESARLLRWQRRDGCPPAVMARP